MRKRANRAIISIWIFQMLNDEQWNDEVFSEQGTYLLGWKHGSEVQHEEERVQPDHQRLRMQELQDQGKEGSQPGGREPQVQVGRWEWLVAHSRDCSCRSWQCQYWLILHAQSCHHRSCSPPCHLSSPRPGSTGSCLHLCAHTCGWSSQPVTGTCLQISNFISLSMGFTHTLLLIWESFNKQNSTNQDKTFEFYHFNYCFHTHNMLYWSMIKWSKKNFWFTCSILGLWGLAQGSLSPLCLDTTSLLLVSRQGRWEGEVRDLLAMGE